MLKKRNKMQKSVANQIFTNFESYKKMNMETIKIEFQSSIKEKLIEFLNSFSKSELHIVEEDSSIIEDKSFVEYRDRLHLAVQKIESGESKLYDIDELDAMLEKTISKYEN
jgi:hypothetical protein